MKPMTTPPMRRGDIQMILPYGTMVGGHVIPTSHQYLEPWDRTLGRDRYEVRAAMDATLYSISRRAQNVETGEETLEEFQLWFAVTCTHLYYYDLMTSLSPDLLAVFEEERNGDFASVNVPVVAGQVVGKIGAQTLDYGVWDTELDPPRGIIDPSHYVWDELRIYLADPLDYYTKRMKRIMLAKYVRTKHPVSGQVAYDIDTKLVGGWFLEGTGGSMGPGEYWVGHLAFAPNYVDPTVFMISVGDVNGDERQFSISRQAPDPRRVGIAEGLVKYDLYPWVFMTAEGEPWDYMHFTKGPTIVNDIFPSEGCALVQLIEERKIRFEVVPGTSCGSLDGFTDAARIYER